MRRWSAGGSARRPTTSSTHRAAEIEAALSGPEHEPVPCHNDLLAANFLHDGTRIRIVDWEYAGMGDRYFDLGNFAVNNGLDEERGGGIARGVLRRARRRRTAAPHFA